MKTFISSIVFILFIIGSLAFVSCSKNDNSANNNNNPLDSNSSMTATISGAISLDFQPSQFHQIMQGINFTYRGTSNSGYSIEIIIDSTELKPQTLNLALDYALLEFTDYTTQKFYMSNSGSIVILSNKSRIINGTFSATLADTSNSQNVIHITNGKFNVKY